MVMENRLILFRILGKNRKGVPNVFPSHKEILKKIQILEKLIKILIYSIYNDVK
ncbi:MAG: hypothetical protein CM15mP58_07560 [Burkholderiaceae bacterium]|nr:MAG: hypothetical protein CM15mP58_07560 [Burkholderiaceae bacterium]